MKRLLPFALIAATAAAVYACSDDPTADPTPGDDAGPVGPDATQPGEDSGGGEDGGTDSQVSTGNPIEGASQPKLITAAEFASFCDGPQWHDGALYFSEYDTTNPRIWRCRPPTPCVVERNTATTLDLPIGTTYDENGSSFLTAEVQDSPSPLNQIVRWTADAGAGTAVTLAFDGGLPNWDSPNDLVARKSDGTIYVTDPGYQKQVAGGTVLNRIYRIAPDGSVVEEASFPDAERPNGIALSNDDKTLYVAFSQGVPPAIFKYVVEDDGSLGARTKFGEAPAGSDPDGIAVDEAGNLYLAVNSGVGVYKPDGTTWGMIATDKAASNVAFGGADRKTLYITANGGVYEVTGLKVAGVAR
jgi:gluconolactonase